MNEGTTRLLSLFGTCGRFAGRLFLAAIDLYAALLILYLPLRVLAGDRLGLVALLGTFLHWDLLPAFVLLPLAVRLRRWPAAVMLGICVAVFLVLFGGLFLPKSSASATSSDLTVMTFNVENSHVSPDDLVAALRSSGADIIALLELDDRQAVAIERDLRDLYPYQELYGLGIPGKGLLSQYPILEEELFYLQAQRLPHLRANLEIDSLGSLTVIIAHPRPPACAGVAIVSTLTPRPRLRRWLRWLPPAGQRFCWATLT